MAYTSIDDPTQNFNTKLYTGTGSAQSITGVGFSPEMSWFKQRNTTRGHVLEDIVRGAGKTLFPHDSSGETAGGYYLTSFDSDGFTLPSSNVGTNESSGTYVAWNWKAGGSAPAITYSVKVVSDSGNKYRFDDFGTSAVTLDLQEGGTYTFDQSDSSNAGHPLRFYTASDKSGGEYTTGVTTTGTAGSSGAKTVITVAASAPTLYYQCSNHAGMGGQANTNSTFGSSNFSGSIQSTVSANTTAGFSIVSYASGQSGAFSIGHGLSSAPKIVIAKSRTSSHNWGFYYTANGTNTNFMTLESSDAQGNNNADPDANGIASGGDGYTGVYGVLNSSSISIAQTAYANNGTSAIAYCFEEVKGFSKFGSYTGNGNADGTFVYTGFKPAFFICKRTNATDDWFIFDNKREGYNVDNDELRANTTATEGTTDRIDILSNGIKHRNSGSAQNGSGSTYIYLAFAESPFVNSNGVPTNAR